jgi:hypothetical protein
MSAETGALAATPHPLGKPGGPGLFRDKSLSLPPYIQNIAHSLKEKRGLDTSKAIQMAIGVCQNWASGRGNVKPEVRAAATAAIAAWEAAKAKAHATPNKGVQLSQQADPANVVELSAVGKVFRFRHGWVPVDGDGNELPKSNKVPKSIAYDTEARDHAKKLADAGDYDGAIAHLTTHREKTTSPVLHSALGSTIDHYKKLHESKKRGKHLAQYLADEDEQDELDRTFGTHNLSQPMGFLRDVLDGSQPIDLANAPEPGGSQPKKEATAKKDPKKKSGEEQPSKHQLPPGAVGWKHNWVPVDQNGNPVGPSQKNKSAQEIKDMTGHTDATKAAIASAYNNKAQADAKTAATKAKSAAKRAKAKAEADRKRAAAEAKRRTKAKERAKAKAATEAKRKAAAETRAKTAKAKARQKLIAAATKQALADKKAGRPLTPTQQKLLDHYEAQQSESLDELRNDVKLSQPVAEATTVPTVSSQDGARATVNTLLSKAPAPQMARAARHAQMKRRSRRRKGLK